MRCFHMYTVPIRFHALNDTTRRRDVTFKRRKGLQTRKDLMDRGNSRKSASANEIGCYRPFSRMYVQALGLKRSRSAHE